MTTLLLLLLLGGNNMLLSSVNGLTGTLAQLGQQQAAYAHAHPNDGGYDDLPLDQLVSMWSSLGGAGGSQGLIDEMNRQGNPQHFTAQDFGVPWDTLMPGLAAYYQANPNQMPDTTPNTQNLADIVTNNTASQFLDGSGNFTGSKADWDAAQQAAINKYHLGAGDRSFGALAKSFLTEGALPPIVAAAFAGGGLDSFLNGGGFGASGLGDGGAFDMGGSTGFGGSTPIGADATWGVNPRDLTSLADPFTSPEIPEVYQTPGSVAPTPPNTVYNPLTSRYESILQNAAPVGTGTPTMNPGNAAPNTPPGASSALQRILKGDGSATAADYLSIAGSLGSGALGIAGSDAARSANNSLADKYLAYGAPSRARYEASMTPGFDANSISGFKSAMDYGAKSSMNALSTQGNPIGSPNAWNQTLSDVTAKIGLPAIQNYQAQNANAGGISTFTPAGINATNAASGATTNMFNAAGSTLNDIFSPKKSLAQTLAEYQQMMKA